MEDDEVYFAHVCCNVTCSGKIVTIQKYRQKRDEQGDAQDGP